VIDRGYESRPVLKIVANPPPYGDTMHGDRYQLSARQLVKKTTTRNKFDGEAFLARKFIAMTAFVEPDRRIARLIILPPTASRTQLPYVAQAVW